MNFTALDRSSTPVRHPVIRERPGRGREHSLVALQRTAGNAAVASLLTVQRAEQLVADTWTQVPLDIEALPLDEAIEIREGLFSPLLNTAGTWKLDRAETRRLHARIKQLEYTPEAAKAKEKKADEQAERLASIGKALAAGEPWTWSRKPSKMGESALGFTENWELAFTVGQLTGVVHLHFNTNDHEQVSEATLGKGHIKTWLEGVGHIDLPASMRKQAVDQARGATV